MPKFAAANDKLARLYQYLGSIDWSTMVVRNDNHIRQANTNLCPLQVRAAKRLRYTTEAASATKLTCEYVEQVVWNAADARVADSAYPWDARRMRRWMLDKIRKARTGQIALPLSQ